MTLKACCLSCLLIASAIAPARAEEPPAKAPDRIVVRQCHVYVGDDPAKGTDCTVEANRECAGKPMCEVGIGDNLTPGTSPPEDAQVLIVYACGALSGEAGPHLFNRHATATLACAFAD
ncbi:MULTISPECIES: hypothetical protein [unclassified Sphingomonas]|uniref:hypothetical protein n=1 Tax=unclassified Sphingomonas TaxID=196159 RepID=UPI0007006686|nr:MULTISPECIES: hypothetical protein [unclassified Sphingomonas]KQX22819.1 hypothetical protein ASD17_05995 [Sphingomonas sp. Root1294]KQY67700.1 hypothetical protein ASD39_07125 [Sphingomonas sp. Root50]KRB88642.1 hypothetical protein ASE22_19590 [Sphingomonas sp. Root720]